jgi:hypothetical protein
MNAEKFSDHADWTEKTKPPAVDGGSLTGGAGDFSRMLYCCSKLKMNELSLNAPPCLTCPLIQSGGVCSVFTYPRAPQLKDVIIQPAGVRS